MSETQRSLVQRFVRAGLLVLFSLILLIPKALGLRHRAIVWNSLRVAVAAVGFALLLWVSSGSLRWVGRVLGFVLIVGAVWARPVRAGKSVDEQARELGALVVVNGGKWADTNGAARPVRLFVTPNGVQVVNGRRQTIRSIPLQAVGAIRVEAEGARRRLVLEMESGAMSFHYDGFFAEHLARVAENTLRSRLRRELPVLN